MTGAMLPQDVRVMPDILEAVTALFLGRVIERGTRSAQQLAQQPCKRLTLANASSAQGGSSVSSNQRDYS